MYLLTKDGGRNLLEFLRNLTPQVLLATTDVVLYLIWRQNGSLKIFALFLLITAIALLALLANANNFMDNAFSHSAAIAAERDRLKKETLTRFARLKALLKYICLHKPGTLLELVVAFCILYAGLYAVATTVGLGVLRIMEQG